MSILPLLTPCRHPLDTGMSDSFAELWNSSGSAQPKKPVTLGAARQPSTSNLSTVSTPSYGARLQSDVFSLLASKSATSSQPNSRPYTPSTSASVQQQQNPSRTASALGRATPSMQSNTTSDAFTSLLGSSFPSTSKAANASIAERQAALQRELQELSAKEKQSTGTVWSGLDMLGARAGGNSTTTTTTKQALSADDDWLLGSIPSSSASTSTAQPDARAMQATHSDDLDLLSDFASAPTQTASSSRRPPSARAMSISLFDTLDDFEGGASSMVYAGAPNRQSPVRVQSDVRDDFDFDFGDREDREDGLLASISDDEGGADDVLGILSKPVSQTTRKSVRPFSIPFSALIFLIIR